MKKIKIKAFRPLKSTFYFAKSILSKALTIQSLRKTYKNKFTAVDGINLEVKEGDFFALLGRNGAGKTTTIGIIVAYSIKHLEMSKCLVWIKMIISMKLKE